MEGFKLSGASLVRKTRAVNEPYKIWIPKELRRTTFNYFHEVCLIGGYQGVFKTVGK